MAGERPRASPVGVLVLKVWWESSDPDGLRVRVLTVDDIEVGKEVVSRAGTVVGALDLVREWLERQTAERLPPANP